jgi:hypothetical protein
MNHEWNLFPDATVNYDVSGSENRSKKEKTKQINLKLLFFRRNHGVSQPKTLTEALPLFPNATRLSVGGEKKAANHDQDCIRKKKTQTLP